MSTQILWTPKGEATVNKLMLTDAGVLTRLRGFDETRTDQSFTVGNRHVSIVQSSYEEYAVRVQAVRRDSEVNAVYNFGQISAFVSHAQSGGEFEFLFNNLKALNTTLTAAATKGDTTITLGAITGLEGGDWIHIADANDRTRYELARVVVPATTSLSDPLNQSYPISSPVRHFQYMPKCVALVRTFQFQERDAGRGPNLWDLSFTFRTVV